MTGVFFAILFGLIFVSFPCKGQISLPPGGDTFYVLPGQNVTLAWKFNISNVLARTWTFLPNSNSFAQLATDGTVTKSPQYSPGPFSIKRPSTLILENVNIQYNGTYKFFIVATAPYSSYVTVIVEVKANVTINCTNSLTVVNEGDDFTYLCETKGGNPPANVTWKKDGLPAPGRSGKEQNILTRVNVSGADSGTYTCVAKGHTLTNNISCEVKVRPNAKPGNTNITLTPKTVKVGENVTITCESNGVPEPKYNITHNGTEISTEKTYIIPMVNKTHAGTYKCFVWNKLGNDSDSDTLTVEGQITPTPTISTPTISTPSTSYAATSSITSNGTEPAPTTRPTTPPSSAPTSSSTGGLSTGAIIGIIIGVLVLIIIVVVVVVYYCKSKEKERSNNSANIDPVPGNGHELEEPGPSDGAYDTVWTSGSKSKAPVENALPPVYAAVDKNNRQGNTLYASLDNKALKSSRASKKEPDRPQQTEYASIDFAKTGNAPKAV